MPYERFPKCILIARVFKRWTSQGLVKPINQHLMECQERDAIRRRRSFQLQSARLANLAGIKDFVVISMASCKQCNKSPSFSNLSRLLHAHLLSLAGPCCNLANHKSRNDFDGIMQAVQQLVFNIELASAAACAFIVVGWPLLQSG